MKVVIVGGVAGGATAAARLRRLDESAEIVVFERSGYVSYANCGLPYYIGGVITDRAELTLQTPESFWRRFRVDMRVRHEVTAIHPDTKTVDVKNLATGEVFAEFKRNEDKFFKRMQRDDSYGFEDGTTELYNSGICVPDFTGELFEEEKDSRIVWAAVARLTPTQKKYVRQHLFGGKTFTRIAKDEGKSIKTVQEAYIAAIKKMKKFLKTPSNLDS